MKLVLVRHGESVWNKENLFTGWMDVKLSDRGENEAAEAGKLLKDSGFEFDICYTSMLKRAIKTLNLILEQMDYDWLPVLKDWRLNERHYGALQGLNKIETAKKYGEDQVKIWRRSYDVRPPELKTSDTMYTDMLKRYRSLENPPLAESLKDTVARVIPYFESDIKPKMLAGENVLIAAHGNSLRALVKYFENLSVDAISEVNIPTGIPLVYEFDDNFTVLKKYYLGDSDAAEKKAQAVANQMKEER